MPWFRCTVNQAGPAEDGNVYIMLSDRAASSAFTGRFFIAFPAQQKPMLATALTAMTSNFAVDAALPDPPNQYAQIERLYCTSGE